MRIVRRYTLTVRGYGWRFTAIALGVGLLLMAIVACSPGAGSTSPSPVASGPRLSFKEQEHDFGQFPHSQKMEYRFAFTNTGSAPLQIGEIRAEPIDPASCA